MPLSTVDQQHARGGPARPADTGSAPEGTAAPGAQIVVDDGGYASMIDVGSVRKWARDIGARDEAALIRKCWTFPPEYIRERYLGPGTAAFARALGQPAMGTEAGVGWGGADGLVVFVSWAEGESEYACPRVTLGPGDSAVPDDLVAYRVERYIRRAQGRPVDPGDTEDAYPLLCGIERGDVSAAAEADPGDIDVREIDPGDWTVTAGPVTFAVHGEPGGACIASAAR